jgi:hypothetical protein
MFMVMSPRRDPMQCGCLDERPTNAWLEGQDSLYLLLFQQPGWTPRMRELPCLSALVGACAYSNDEVRVAIGGQPGSGGGGANAHKPMPDVPRERAVFAYE